MQFGTGKSWSQQSTPEMSMKAAKSFSNPPPAIIQSEKHNCEWYLRDIRVCDEMYIQDRGMRIKAFKDSGTWRERWETWAEACTEGLEMSKSQANRVIAQWVAHDAPLTEEKSKTLRKIKDFPDPTTPPREDPPEKPSVQAATPEQMKPKAKVEPEENTPSENGKPKHSLAIWKELTESIYGRALNRIDELNRQCPNPPLHARLIAADKQCMEILDQWQKTVM